MSTISKLEADTRNGKQAQFADARELDATALSAAVPVDQGLLERRYAIARQYNAHGVCVFDRDQRLVLANDQYSTLYGLDPASVRVGMSLREILSLRIEKGIYGSNGAAAYKREWLRNVHRRKTRIQDLIDGRCILIVQQPTSDGQWITTHEDITERLRSEAQVTFLATRDFLTGLANRAALMARLEGLTAQRSGADRIGLVLIDLDHFKPVNDTFGHDVGDEVLRIAAARIRCHVRDTDTVARLGGDEFVVLQGAVRDMESIAHRVERLQTALSAPFMTRSGAIDVGASAGVAVSGLVHTTPETLLKSADLALYAAKDAGRGTVRVMDLARAEVGRRDAMPLSEFILSQRRDTP